MKKITCALLCVMLCVSLCSGTVFAYESYDVIYSDITVCINHYNIPSFVVNGQSVVVINDLTSYGLHLEKTSNGGYNITCIGYSQIKPAKYEIDVNQLGTCVGTAQKNVVPVYINNYRVDSYQMNGYTLVPAETFTAIGKVNWVPEQKALKIWIEGLPLKATFDPPAQNKAASVYKETLEVVEAYRAVGEYEQAVSALDWTINAIGSKSAYFKPLNQLREEMAYIAAMKNINLCVAGGNTQNAIYEAQWGIGYCTDDSAYYNALASKYAELTYKEASKNINIHLKKGDYYSAYITANNAMSAVDDYGWINNDIGVYYNKLYNDVISICKAWRKKLGRSFVVLDTGYTGQNSNRQMWIQLINLYDEPVIAFRCKADICDVFGQPLSWYYENYNLRCDDTWHSAYAIKTYYWNFNGTNARVFRNLGVSQVVWDD